MKEIIARKDRVVLVDDDDYEWLPKNGWGVNKFGYASRAFWKGGKCKRKYMHRIINQTPEGYYTDHINRNKLDNRKCNLRTVTPTQSQTNTDRPKNNISGCIGVRYDSWHTTCNPWLPRIRIFKEQRDLGRYPTMDEAKATYEAFKKIKNYAKFHCVKGCCCD